MITCSYSFLSNLQFTSKYALNRQEIGIYIAILSLFACNIHIFLYNPSIEIILQIIIMISYLVLIRPPNLSCNFIPIFLFLHPFLVTPFRYIHLLLTLTYTFARNATRYSLFH